MATTPIVPSTVPADDPRLAVLLKYAEYCNTHNFDAMETFYTSPININDEPWAPSKVTAQFKPIVKAFPDWQWDIYHLSIDGEYLACHFKVTGTHLGTFQGIEPTGRKISVMQFTLYHLVDGKYCDVWDLTDFDSLMKQIQ